MVASERFRVSNELSFPIQLQCRGKGVFYHKQRKLRDRNLSHDLAPIRAGRPAEDPSIDRKGNFAIYLNDPLSPSRLDPATQELQPTQRDDESVTAWGILRALLPPSPVADSIDTAMAPMPLDNPTTLKRKATTAEFDAPVAKRKAVVHHHQFTWSPTEVDRHQIAPLDKPSVDALLERTLALALGAVGFAGVQDGIIGAFRVEVEECTRMLLSGISDCADSHRYASTFWRRQAVNA